MDDKFDPAALTKAAEDSFTVRRVFGEAYQHEGVLVIPVARVAGMTGLGSGGGEGEGIPLRMGPPAVRPAHDEAGGEPPTGHGSGHGGGGGWGLHVKPLGVYVVDGTGAHWKPAVDVNRLMLGAQLVAAWGLAIGFTAWALRRR